MLTVVGAVALKSNAQTPTPPLTSANLVPIAFFTAHEWDAQLTNAPDGKTRKIHAELTWTKSGQAIRISNQMLTDGKPAPYVDGLYAWDPQQRAIVFWYVDAQGSLTKGTVKPEAGTLVHEFTEIKPDGKTADYVARVTPRGDASWENEILARTEKGLISIVKVRYEAAR